MNLEEVKPQFNRVKGASWFPSLYNKDVMVLGQGGIGSWTSLLLARIGCKLYIYDMDKYEVHNMTGQIVKQAHLERYKVSAMAEVIAEFSPNSEVYPTAERYTSDSPANDIMICGFDNMLARKIAFENWKRNMEQDVHDIGADRASYFFQDGRLLAEQLQIFNIPGDREDLIERYEKEYLFDDSEVKEAECTFKQTSHCAAMIASHMVGFLTNWVVNNLIVDGRKSPIRSLPFYYQYVIPINLATNDYVRLQETINSPSI